MRGTMEWAREHRGAAGLLVSLCVAVVAFVFYWFAPHKLVLDERVDESLPTSSPPMIRAAGALSSLEHETSGRALLVEFTDGSRYLRLEDLDTSNGPDLRVWLTDRSLSDEWRIWDDGEYVDLGALEGNIGDSNYEIPDGVDLDKYRTAVIWCRRFTVGFGVSPLTPT